MVNSQIVPGRGACLPPVKIIGLDKHGVVTQTPDPDIALPHQVQLDPLADVESRLLAGLGPVDVAEGAKTEPAVDR